MEQGLVWVEVYLPFDPVSFADFQAAVKEYGSAVEAEKALPDLARKALTPIDTHGEAMLAADLEQLAHAFLVRSRKHDVEHDEAVVGSVHTVESFLNGPEVASPHFWPGAWVVVLKVDRDSEEWRRIESGELDAVSFQAFVSKQPIIVREEAP